MDKQLSIRPAMYQSCLPRVSSQQPQMKDLSQSTYFQLHDKSHTNEGDQIDAQNLPNFPDLRSKINSKTMYSSVAPSSCQSHSSHQSLMVTDREKDFIDLDNLLASVQYPSSVDANNHGRQEYQVTYCGNSSIQTPVNSSVLRTSCLKKETIIEDVPYFLREIRMMNSKLPNLKHPIIRNQPETLMLQLSKLLSEIIKAIGILRSFNNMMTVVQKQNQIFIQTFFKEKDMWSYFLNSGWENREPLYVQTIAPVINFKPNMYVQKTILLALQNYQEVVTNFQERSISNSFEPSVYQSIRKKLMLIDKNLQIISEDIYAHYLKIGMLPPHYYQFLNYLKKKRDKKEQEKTEVRVAKYRALLGRLLVLRGENEALCCSEVGIKVKQLLESDLKNLCPL